jgi:GMP synthase-like glutamine amidotransferase
MLDLSGAGRVRGRSMIKILLLEHERETPAALFEDWARARGHALHILRVPELTRWPEPQESDVVVSLGSDQSVHSSPDRWIAREIEFLRAAHDAAIPVLGICFGAQALAKALGGSVARGRQIGLEWTMLETRERDLIPPGPWLRWHEDVFSVPPGARAIAQAGEVPLAFVQGASLGVQFHPEVGADLVNAWIDSSRRTLAEHAIDEHALRLQVQHAAPGASVRAADLFDRIARLWDAAVRRTRADRLS